MLDYMNKYKKLEQPSHVFSGPRFLTKIVKEIDDNVIKLPSYYFSPEFYKDNDKVDYVGDFKPFASHKWGTTKNIYGKI